MDAKPHERSSAGGGRAAVIGGGITGLTTAYYLAERGVPVTLFEPGVVGGVIRSSVQDGFTLEHGPNVLLKKPALADLLKSLRLDDAVIAPAVKPYAQYVWFGGALSQVPKSFGRFVATPLLDWQTKISLLPKLFRKGLLDTSHQEASVRDFFLPLVGRTGADRLLDPVLKGIFGGKVECLQAEALFPELWRQMSEGGSLFSYARWRSRTFGKKEIFVLRGGNSGLVSALLEKVRPRIELLRKEVEGVEPLPEGGFRVTTADGDREVSTVWVATSGGRSASFLEPLGGELSAALCAMRYAAVAVVHLAVARSEPVPDRSFGALFPEGTVCAENGASLLGIMFNSKIFPHLAPEGQDLLTVCLGGVGDERVRSADEDQLGAWAMEGARRFLRVQSPRVLDTTLWPHAIPQYEIGVEKIWSVMAQFEAQYPGLKLLGADRGGVSVPDRVQTVSDAVSALPITR